MIQSSIDFSVSASSAKRRNTRSASAAMACLRGNLSTQDEFWQLPKESESHELIGQKQLSYSSSSFASLQE
jgi:hypothetical protein